MCNIENRSAVLENAELRETKHTHIYGRVTNWQHWGMFIQWGNKPRIPPNTVRVEMPPALSS